VTGNGEGKNLHNKTKLWFITEDQLHSYCGIQRHFDLFHKGSFQSTDEWQKHNKWEME